MTRRSLPDFDGSLFPEERKIIWARMNSYHRQAESVMEGIESQNYWNGWSEFSKAIGYQAIFAIVTMGCAMGIAALISRAATWGAATLRATMGGSLVGKIAAGSTISGIKVLLQCVGKLATLGRGVKMGTDSAALIQASYGVFGRLTVGTILLAWNAAESGDGHSVNSKDGKFWSFDTRICFMVFLAVFGSPKVKAPSRWIRFLGKLPDTASPQTALQSAHLLRVMVRDFMEGPESDELWARVKDEPEAFRRATAEVGLIAVQQLREWAMKEEDIVQLRLECKLAQRDFTKRFSYPTYVGMYWSGKIEDYNFLCRTLIYTRAKRDFWIKVARAVEKIEAATRAAQKLADKRMIDAARRK